VNEGGALRENLRYRFEKWNGREFGLSERSLHDNLKGRNAWKGKVDDASMNGDRSVVFTIT